MFKSAFRTLAPAALVLCSALSPAVSSAAPRVSSGRLSPQLSGDFFAQVLTPWIAVVRDGIDAARCAADVRASGAAEVDGVLGTIGVLLVTTPSADKSGLESLPCILAVEADGEVSAAL